MQIRSAIHFFQREAFQFKVCCELEGHLSSLIAGSGKQLGVDSASSEELISQGQG